MALKSMSILKCEINVMGASQPDTPSVMNDRPHHYYSALTFRVFTTGSNVLLSGRCVGYMPRVVA